MLLPRLSHACTQEIVVNTWTDAKAMNSEQVSVSANYISIALGLTVANDKLFKE